MRLCTFCHQSANEDHLEGCTVDLINSALRAAGNDVLDVCTELIMRLKPVVKPEQEVCYKEIHDLLLSTHQKIAAIADKHTKRTMYEEIEVNDEAS